MRVIRIWKLVELCLAWTLMLGAAFTIDTKATAQSQPSAITTTHIQDTIYNANGSAATGTVLISWPSFSTAGGSSVPAGSTSVTLGSNGSLSVQLAPNAGSTPMGSYYTVTYHLTGGSNTLEYWVVPAQAGAVAVNTIKSTVLPASVAMQTVSKTYVDTAIAAAVAGTSADDPAEPYVLKAGDTMTGPLVLPGDPTSALQASDKNYVDGQVAAIAGGLGQKVSTVPLATQIVIQPAGTELAVNRLNNVEQASQYATTPGATGTNGIANATSSADCASGCAVVVDPGYAPTEQPAPYTWKSQTQVADQRGGATAESFLNPASPNNAGLNAGRSIHVASTQNVPAQIAAGGPNSLISTGMSIAEDALAGGSNVYPSFIEPVVPYFKTTYSALSAVGTNYTLGQHVLIAQQQDCYGVGDCLMGGMFMRASGGFRDHTDEASHPFDIQIAEDSRVFDGTCASGCATGSTLIQITPTANAGTQGEGRYLLNVNPAKTITTGTLIGGSPSGRHPSASFTGTSFPVSTLLEIAQAIPTQAENIQPGTVSVAITTSGAPTGYATNTAALPAGSGVACISDAESPGVEPTNFETATYSTVDASHLQLTLVRPHASGATLAVGGLCGYGLEQTVDTVSGIRQVFPVIASTSSTGLLYAGAQSALVGLTAAQSAYANLNLVVASIARIGNVVTVTTTGNLPQDVNGLTMKVQGVTDSSYNGSFAMTTTGPNTLTYASTGANSTSAGGSLSLVTGGFVLYPMAEALSVFNNTTKAVDGQITLAANTVPWAASDAVEMPHYFQEQIYPDTQFITQYTPRPIKTQAPGITYQGNLGPGVSGWVVYNTVPAGNYFGNGGTHSAPDAGLGVQGIWNRSLDIQAGESAAIAVHCNSHGCGKWNSAYDLFAMDTSVGQDHLNYSPETSTLTFNLRGTGYQFTPLGLTLGTLNATNLNVATINGSPAGPGGGSVTNSSIAAAINNQTYNTVNLSLPWLAGPPANVGDNNTLMGVGAGTAIVSAREMTVFGAQACSNVVGNAALGVENGLDTCIGSEAGMSLVTTGSDGSVDNVFLGQKAGTNVINSQACNFVGTHSGTALVGCVDSTVDGAHSLNDSGTGGVATEVTVVGAGSADGAGNKSYDTVVGAIAAPLLSTGISDDVIGNNAAALLTTGSENVVHGQNAAPGLVAGSGNTMIGQQAGPSVDDSGDVWIGVQAGAGVSSANNATVIGSDAVNHGGAVTNSVLVGDNIANQGSGANLNHDVIVGSQSALHLATSDVTIVGYKTGVSLTSGYGNVLIGSQTAQLLTGGTNNVVIGNNAGVPMTGNESNNVVVGVGSTGTGISNAAEIGSGTNSVNGSLQFNSTTVIDGQQNLHANVAAPAQSSACTAGAIVVNSGFIYVCVATNTWQRAALTTY